MNNLLKKVNHIESIEHMKQLLKSTYSKSENEYKIGITIRALNKMDKGDYSYVLEAPIGVIDHPNFDPYFSPQEMLELGVFEGKYLNDCILEFPKEWFIKAIESGSLSPEGPNIDCNFFKIKSRQSLVKWRENGWIPQTEDDPDNRGWFQWFCRYWIGRRIPKLDDIQIARWRAFKRHYGQVKKNCSDLTCRPKQRQALLQWSYNAFI
jgi:hypothetical protein